MDMRAKKRRNRLGKGNFATNFLLILFAIGLLGIITITQSLRNESIVHGVYIDDEHVGGMDKEKAIQHIKNSNTPRLDQLKITLSHGENSWVFHYYDIDAKLNIEETVEKAYLVGNGGNFFNRLSDRQNTKKETAQLTTHFIYEEQKLRDALNFVAQKINTEPTDALLLFQPDHPERFIITPEKQGNQLNIEGLLAFVDQKLDNGESIIAIDIIPEIVMAQVTAADFIGKTEKLITFGTDLSMSAPDRTHNIIKAAQKFHGMVVRPGQVVSFNGTTGERSFENGYKNAPMIKADKSLEDAPGGGVSQTSSTLYNAVLRAGLEVIEFTRHSFPSSYVDKGLDTTVNLPLPVIDLKFRNNKSSPVFIRTFYENQNIYFEIYGEPLPEGQIIKIRTEEYETVPASEPSYINDIDGEYVQYVDEEFEKVKSRDGYKVRVYREIFKGNQLVISTLLDDHYYRPIRAVVYKGVQERPEIVTEDSIHGGGNSDIWMEILDIIY